MELHALFVRLDSDGDKRISAADFRHGFSDLAANFELGDRLTPAALDEEYRRLAAAAAAPAKPIRTTSGAGGG